MKHSTHTTSLRLLPLFVAMAMMLLGGATASAAGAKNIVKIVLDTDYTIPMGDSYYSFDAQQSGVLRLKATGNDVPRPCTDSTFTEQSPNYTYMTSTVEMNVTAGQTYYFNVYSLNSSTSFRATMVSSDEKIDTLATSPANGSVLEVTDTYPISVQFNTSVRVGSATMTSGDNSATVSPNVHGAYAAFSVKGIIFDWMKNGLVNTGDKVTITIADARSAIDSTRKFGDDGTLVIEYYVPGMPTMLESKSLPEKFLSYWAKGDTDGKVVLTYQSKLKYGATASITFGNVEDDNEFYKETLPVTVSGNTLTVDFTGKIRTPKSMLPSSSDPLQYTSIFLRISGVADASGKPCYAEGQSSYGSYQVSLPYENVARDVITEFTPKSGSDISGSKTIELWIAGKSALLYSGVNFAYTYAGKRKSVVVKNADITETMENDDEYALTIPVPDEVRRGSAVVVSLADLQFTDGQERDITAHYNVLKVAMNNPADNKEDVLVAGDSINVQTNMADSIGYLLCQVRDLNAESADKAIVKATAAMAKNADGTFGLAITDNIYLWQDHTYAFEFTAYRSAGDITDGLLPIDTASVYVTGIADSTTYTGIATAGQAEKAKANAQGVYTIGGAKASGDSSKAALDRLPSGLYIVGGKKVALKH